jgi:fido (protein-threonine AMPylation protein)
MTRLSVDNIEHLETAIEYLIDAISEVGLSKLDELEDLAEELHAKVSELNSVHGFRRLYTGGQ